MRGKDTIIYRYFLKLVLYITSIGEEDFEKIIKKEKVWKMEGQVWEKKEYLRSKMGSGERIYYLLF